MKSDFSGWFDNLGKGDVAGHCEWMWGSSRGCTPSREWCRLPPAYFWVTWHQTTAFLISVNYKKWLGWLVFRKVDVSGNFERFPGWSRGCTPQQECCRLPHTYFWVTWHQTTAFLISVNYEKWLGWLVWQFRKRRRVGALWVDVGVIPRLHSASGISHNNGETQA
jgi:hypothetical protein